MTSVSIIICSKDRHDSLLRTLHSVGKFSYDERLLELIIVEETNKPQPPTGERIRYYPIPERGLGIAFARNFGLKKARGSIVIFIDDDVLLSQNWFDNLLQPFEANNVGAVGGAILPSLQELSEIGKAISLLGFPAGGLSRYLQTDGKIIETNLISTGNCGFRVDLARRIGGFDEFLRWGGEDQDFFSRLCEVSKAVFTPKAIVFHNQRDSYKEVFLWFIRRGKAEFYRKCKVHHSVSALMLPLRSNFLLKMAVFFSLFFTSMSYSAIAAIALAAGTLFVWENFVWHRAVISLKTKITADLPRDIHKIRAYIVTPPIRRILFLVKMTMDLGQELGRLLGFMRFLCHRIFSKPLVLTFHNLGKPPVEKSGPEVRYFYSVERFQSLVQDSQREGRHITSLSELIRRLKDNPRTLYFEKTLAITFDDAYRSLYSAFADFFQRGYIPLTVFVPTACVGKSNKWDLMNGVDHEDILDWQQLANLRERCVDIGSHSRHHPRLTECDSDVKIDEIMGSLDDLKRFYPDSSGFLFSYPYGAYDGEIREMVRRAGYMGAVANFAGSIRPSTDPWQIPRFTVFAEDDWKGISAHARSLWIKELLKDIRDQLPR